MARGLRGASRYENELANLLWESGFAVVRAAASGKSRYRRQPDIMAVKRGLILVVEVKYSTGSRPVYIDRERVEALREIAGRAGGLALVAVRRRGGLWLFYQLPSCNGETRYCRVDHSEPLASGVSGLLERLEHELSSQGYNQH